MGGGARSGAEGRGASKIEETFDGDRIRSRLSVLIVERSFSLWFVSYGIIWKCRALSFHCWLSSPATCHTVSINVSLGHSPPFYPPGPLKKAAVLLHHIRKIRLRKSYRICIQYKLCKKSTCLTASYLLCFFFLASSFLSKVTYSCIDISRVCYRWVFCKILENRKRGIESQKYMVPKKL